MYFRQLSEYSLLEEKNKKLEALVNKQTEKLKDTEKQLEDLREQYNRYVVMVICIYILRVAFWTKKNWL